MRVAGLALVGLVLGCASPPQEAPASGPEPASPARCQDRSRLGYLEGSAPDQIEEVHTLLRSIGAADAELVAISQGRPNMINHAEVARALEREYPSALRAQGIRGSARVGMLVTEAGRVEAAEVTRSAGHPELDEAAVRVAMGIRFTPPQSQGVPICFVLAFPVTFTTR